jgi:hypothetical protein
MRIRFLTSIAAEEFSYGYGQIAYVETELAQKWVASGIAVSLEPVGSAAKAPEQRPAPAEKLRSEQLSEELQRTRKLLESKQAELAETRSAAEDSAIEAILTGKKNRAPGLLTKVRGLEAEIEELRNSLQPLERALAVVKAEEDETAARAEAARIADLKVQHRAAAKSLIEAIESGDLTAASQIQEAEMHIARIRFEFPKKKQPAQIVVHNASMITIDDQMRLNLFAQICESGYPDLFPPDHLARRRYEHHQAREKRENERITREQAARRGVADSFIVPDEVGTFTERRPRM